MVEYVSVKDLQIDFKDAGYNISDRVLRWRKAKTSEIKNFGCNKMGQTYANLSEEDIMRQKEYHDLQPVALLLCINDHKDYFFETPRGKSAFAAFERRGTTYEGMLEVGISDKKTIYHLMFNDQVKHKPEQLFQITEPIFEDSFKDSQENDQVSSQWCNKDGFTIQKEGDTYVVTLNMPTSTQSGIDQPCTRLFIYPNKLSSKFIKKG